MRSSSVESAFPIHENVSVYSRGMELRDYFAIKAMAVLLEKLTVSSEIFADDRTKELIATNAYLYADAMIEAR